MGKNDDVVSQMAERHNMTKVEKTNYSVTIGFALWALWLSSIYFIRGPLSYLKIHANADGYVSRAQWFGHWAAQGAASLLEPSMCNVDRMADFGMPTIVELLCSGGMPVQVVFVLLMFFQRFVGGVFTYKLLYELFRIPRGLAVLGGMAFTVGATRGENVGVEWIYLHFLHEPGFPLLLYAFSFLPINKLFRSSVLSVGIGLFLALTSQVEIGPVFTLPCAFLFGMIARSDLKRPSDYARYFFLTFVVGLGFLLYQWPHLLAAVLHAPNSARASLLTVDPTYRKAFNLFQYRMGKMFPHIILCFVWLFSFNKRSRPEVALLCMLLLTVFGGVFLRPFLNNYSEYIGFFSSFNLDRLFLYGPFFLVLASIMGLSRLPFGDLSIIVQRRSWQKTISPILLLSIVLCLCVANLSIASFEKQWHASLNLNRQGENWHRLYDNPELKALKRKIAYNPVPVRTVTVGAKDSTMVWQPAFNLAYGLETVDGFKMIYSGRFHEFWRLVVAPAYKASKNNLTRGFMDRYGSRMFLFPPEKDPEILPAAYNHVLLSLANVGYFIADKPVDDPRLELLPRVYTREMIEQWERKPIVKKIAGLLQDDYLGEPLYIYRNRDVFPRIFAVDKVRFFANDMDLLDALGDASISELRSTVFLVDKGMVELGQQSVAGVDEVDVLSYSLERIRVRSQSKKGHWLVLTNTYSPFWKCRINGEEYPLVAAYHAFMAVHVPRGVNEVEFVYSPPYTSWIKLLFGG